MKKNKILSLIIIFILLLTYIYNRFFSLENINGKINVENASKLNIGMNKKEVFILMGKPENTFSIENNSYILKYLSNNVDYLDIEITIDSNEKICSIFIPK